MRKAGESTVNLQQMLPPMTDDPNLRRCREVIHLRQGCNQVQWPVSPFRETYLLGQTGRLATSVMSICYISIPTIVSPFVPRFAAVTDVQMEEKVSPENLGGKTSSRTNTSTNTGLAYFYVPIPHINMIGLRILCMRCSFCVCTICAPDFHEILIGPKVV